MHFDELVVLFVVFSSILTDAFAFGGVLAAILASNGPFRRGNATTVAGHELPATCVLYFLWRQVHGKGCSSKRGSLEKLNHLYCKLGVQTTKIMSPHC